MKALTAFIIILVSGLTGIYLSILAIHNQWGY